MISFLSNSTPQTYKTWERDGDSKNVQPEICQNIIKEHAKNISESQRKTIIIFHSYYFPKSRKSELHNVLHGIRVHVKFCSLNTFPKWARVGWPENEALEEIN